jgi:type VI secretion system secreted protein Hcp
MAAVDFFLKIDGVDGESGDSKHKGEIELESWSWGETQVGAHSAIHIVTRVSKASPKLMQACATGEHYKKAVLTCRKAGKEQQEYLKITFSDLLVSSFQIGGSAGSSILPTEQVSLNFAKIEFEYKEQKADGTLGAVTKSGYDLKANKVV